MNSSYKKRYNPVIIGLLLVLIVIVFFGQSGGSGSIISQIDDGVLGVARDERAVIIQLSDITSAELVSDFNIGEPVSVGEGGIEQPWVYRNDELGEYCFYAYEEIERYIIVYHNDGILVFNSNSVKNTKKIYEELIDSIAKFA